MKTETIKLNVDSANLYKELSDVIHSLYMKHKGFFSCTLFCHSTLIYKLKLKEPINSHSAEWGQSLEIERADMPSQTVQLKTSDSLDVAFLEVRTQN